jgi:hypothetical protein
LLAGLGKCEETSGCTLHGLPVGFGLADAKADERQVLLAILDDAGPTALLPGPMLTGDKNYYGRDFEAALARAGLRLLRPARHSEPGRPGHQFSSRSAGSSSRSTTPSKGQLDRERHSERTQPERSRALKRVLALTAAIWHNDHTGQPVMRPLIAYDYY